MTILRLDTKKNAQSNRDNEQNIKVKQQSL